MYTCTEVSPKIYRKFDIVCDSFIQFIFFSKWCGFEATWSLYYELHHVDEKTFNDFVIGMSKWIVYTPKVWLIYLFCDLNFVYIVEALSHSIEKLSIKNKSIYFLAYLWYVYNCFSL